MKKYIILTFNVCNIGGGQLFVLRRCQYLISKGFQVFVFTAFDNGVFPLRDSFVGIPIYNYKEFARSSSVVSKNRKEKIIREVLSKVGKAEDYFIESHTLETIEWGEIVAAECKGRHLAYPLAEPLISKFRYNPGRDIANQKLGKNEFYGCNSVSLKHIFEREVPHNNYINIAFDESELVEYCNPRIEYHKRKDNYVITTVSRLDKTYIEPFISNVKRLALKYPSQYFVMIVAGGSNTESREKDLLSKYVVSDINNLKIIFTGYIKELGKDLFKMTDVFVGMGTAAINAISQGCVSINIDPSMKDMASGIFGVDTKNFAYTESGHVFSIYEKLEEVFLMGEDEKKIVQAKARELFENHFEMQACFTKMDSTILNLRPVNKVPYLKVSTLYRIYARVHFKCILTAVYLIKFISQFKENVKK